MSQREDIPGEDEVDYGTGEGPAYGGQDGDVPIFIPHADDGGSEHSEEEQDGSGDSKYRGNILERVTLQFRWLFSSSSGWNATASVVIAVSTVFYTVYAHRQWVAMSDQISQMRETNRLTQLALQGSDATLSKTLGKMDEQIKATNRLATDTEIANENVLDNDRPWIGAYLQGEKFEAGKKAKLTFIYVNSGRRPARYDVAIMHGNLYRSFPDPEKEYDYSGIQSTGIIVPNGTTQSATSPDHELTETEIKTINSNAMTFYVFAKMEYRDVRTQSKHWVHICYQYIPPSKTWDGGFEQCHHYNETDDEKR